VTTLPGGRGGNKDVVREPLLDVWSGSRCRIDNSLDQRYPPFTKEEIKQRALDLAEGREDYPPYHLADNNCEHFASWVRNGFKFSKQVVETGGNKTVSGCFFYNFIFRHRGMGTDADKFVGDFRYLMLRY